MRRLPRMKYQYRVRFSDGDWTIWVTLDKHQWDDLKESDTLQKREVEV